MIDAFDNYVCEGQLSLFDILVEHKKDSCSEAKVKLFNQDCLETMQELEDKVDLVLTSPFYNTNKKQGKNRTLESTRVKKGQYNYVRYDVHTDSMTDDEYADFTASVFKNFDEILKPNGCILYNLSYGSENTECMFKAVNSIITDTTFTVADVICWKKPTALPNSCSPNKLTRIWEFVFVFCRKNEAKSFFSNKKITSKRKTGQNAYENIYNFIEAKNNDGSCPFNKATYSSELCEKLIDIYAPINENTIVYDPFIGSGTTAVACLRKGIKCYGSEISLNQIKYAKKRIMKEFAESVKVEVIRKGEENEQSRSTEDISDSSC